MVEGTPVHPDPHGGRVLDRHLNDLLEVGVPVFGPDVARINTVLRQCLGALRELREKKMAVVVKVADDRHVGALIRKPRHDLGHSSSGGLVVDRHAHQLAAGLCQGAHLSDRAHHVGGVGVRHRLNHDRILSADLDPTDVHDNRRPSRPVTHVPPCLFECWEPSPQFTEGGARLQDHR